MEELEGEDEIEKEMANNQLLVLFEAIVQRSSLAS